MKRVARRLPALVVLAGLGLAGREALAEPNDARAGKLAADAISSDYLRTHFAEAEAKLRQALDLCKSGGCSAKVRARVHRDLAVVLVQGLNQVDAGKLQLVEALRADPGIALDPDLTTEQLEAAFAEARRLVGLGAAPAASGSATPASSAEIPDEPPPVKPAQPAAPAAVSGGIVHSPPDEQTINTPVPLYAELPDGTKPSKVVVRYKTFGASAWKSVEMTRARKGYGAEIPCLDVSDIVGNLSYYIEALGPGDEVLASSGSREAPHKLPIKTELEGDPPHIPGQPPPARCSGGAGACPPDFPGCDLKRGGDDPGDAPAEKGTANWLSASFQQDWLVFTSTQDVCGGGNDYACFFENPESYYEDLPYHDPSGDSGDEVTTGIKLATSRLLLGFDRLFGEHVTGGVRLGYAFGGGPKAPSGNAFFPVHAEARGAYWFGDKPFSRSGLRPFVALALGAQQIDAKVIVTVYVNQADYNADRRTKLAAWRKAGVMFASLGGGAAYGFGTQHELFIDVRAMQLFGASGTALGAALGYAYGF